MRLTKKLKPPYEQVLGQDYVYTSETRLTPSFASVEQKLGQLEDIEEELGIDLITLFKALKNGVYFENDKKHHIVALDLGSSGNYRLSYQIIDDLFESVYIKDYGKTWALTKEELL